MSDTVFTVKSASGHSVDMTINDIKNQFDKHLEGLDKDFIDTEYITQKVVKGIYQGIYHQELNALMAQTCAYMASIHPDYSLLAGRISIENLHSKTLESWTATLKLLYEYREPHSNEHFPLISDELYELAQEHSHRIEKAIDYKRDFQFDFFAFKTLERSYLLRLSNQIVERPQHMYMRVALGIHGNDIEMVLKTYDMMSRGLFTHASPTLFNAGTMRPQMSSCFLLAMKEDSIEGIYDTLKQCALISQSAGGIGLSIHNIRAKGTFIKGTNGTSNGIIPMLRVFNDTARYVDQGGGKRKGAFAIYIEPWHADIFDFIELRKNRGKDELRTRDLFLALWMNDLFMERVEQNATWSLFCPQKAPGLQDVYGRKFKELYEKYESEKRYNKQVSARDLWFKILEAQTETGLPYMLYKDSANEKSNQKNIGTIKSSNLCTEIIQHTSKDEVAVCNLASIALNQYVVEDKYDFQALYDVVYQVTINLNRIIDRNFYPVPEAKNSNLKHRPIGLGVQGLADTFFKLRYPFESQKALDLNRDIFETIYFAALNASCDLAKLEGTYTSYQGSPVSKGILQFDAWGVIPTTRWDWNQLRQKIHVYGVRNSLLVAPMPTASTSQILGNTESFMPLTSNLYTRRVLSGEFPVINKFLVRDLIKEGLWSNKLKDLIISAGGSIQGIKDIPEELRSLYKTVWEIKQKTILDMAADRGAFIDQSQSLNIYMRDVDFAKLSSMHFYAWKKGLKTGMYYLKSRPAANAIQFTVKNDQETLTPSSPEAQIQGPPAACSIDDPDCISCGS